MAYDDACASSEELVDCEAVLLVSLIHTVAFCLVGKVIPKISKEHIASIFKAGPFLLLIGHWCFP
jgi:hypothetical protein